MTKNGVVFLVDDDHDDRDIFRDALETLDLPITFAAAHDGLHALELINSHGFQQPAIIFLDLNMPRMDGKELLAILRGRQAYQQIPVIIYSTSSMPQDINKTRELGANGYMIKPGSFRQLCNELKSVLNEHLK